MIAAICITRETSISRHSRRFLRVSDDDCLSCECVMQHQLIPSYDAHKNKLRPNKMHFFRVRRAARMKAREFDFVID